MSKSQELKDMTFGELVDLAAVEIHGGLLEGGGKEMKSRIWLWMNQALRWQNERRKDK